MLSRRVASRSLLGRPLIGRSLLEHTSVSRTLIGRALAGRALPAATPLVMTPARSLVLRSNWDESKSRTRRKTSLGAKVTLGLLVLMPIIAFGLGTWQVQRLQWKLDLISRAEDRLLLPPLELPPSMNPAAVEDFDYRRVKVSGEFDHSQEKLVGPRLHNNKRGFYIVTPLKRKNGSTLLIFRGWVNDAHKLQETRPDSLVRGPVELDCLLHRKPGKNSFTPDREPDGVEYHFMDIDAMAKDTGAQPIYIEALADENGGDLPEHLAMRGVPIGGKAKVEFRNSHFQYILTWYGIAVFTTLMLLKVWRQRRAPKVDPMRKKIAHAKKWQ